MDIAGLNMYDTLLRLPLFQGMGQDDLAQVVGHTRFEFSRYKRHDILIQEGEMCRGLTFLTKGLLTTIHTSDNRQLEVREQLPAPTVLQPESLFGLTQRYSMTIIASSEHCDTLSISKEEVNRLLGTFELFRTSLLNIISTQAQRRSHLPWRTRPHSIREKIVRFIIDHCQYPAGAKDIRIRMQSLATEIGESRLNVSRALHAMASERLLEMSREHIHIPRLEDMFGNTSANS